MTMLYINRLLKKHLLPFLLFAFFQANAQINKFQEIVSNNTAAIELYEGIPTADGGYMGVGYAQASTGIYNGNYMVKTDSVGAVQWTINFIDSAYMYLQGVGQTSTGAYIVSGTRTLFGTSSATIGKVSATGTVVWYKRVESGNDGVLAIEHNGGYVFSGEAMGNNNYGTYLFKTDTNGNTLWSHFYEMNGYMRFNSIRRTADGGLFLVGSAGVTNTADVFLMKTDGNGNISWMKRYASDFNDNDAGMFGMQAKDGGYIVSGYTTIDNFANTHAFLMKTDAGGNMVWAKKYGIGDNELGWSTDQSHDGGYILTGSTVRRFKAASDGFLIKTDDTGGVQWVKLFGDAAGDVLVSGNQAANGGYQVIGTSNSFGSSGIRAAYLIKTDSSGNAGCNQLDTIVNIQELIFQSVPVTLPADDPGVTLASRNVTSSNPGTLLTLCSTVGIPAVTQQTEIALVPNPAYSQVTISTPAQDIERISLTDVTGAVIYQTDRLHRSQAVVDISQFPAGTYFYIITAGQKTMRGKLVVIH